METSAPSPHGPHLFLTSFPSRGYRSNTSRKTHINIYALEPPPYSDTALLTWLRNPILPHSITSQPTTLEFIIYLRSAQMRPRSNTMAVPLQTAAGELPVHVQVEIMAAFITLIGVAWIVLATIFVYQFWKPLTGEMSALREARPRYLSNNMNKSSIDLHEFRIYTPENTV
ncbi:hypothetical protein SUNI508_10121 [Seiridium unicorne]|uniref:Uncharacterized protein n=1 Tax=Seiridium unicorne TaxID=138068 RepID=A0ABR2UN02_9PEZI